MTEKIMKDKRADSLSPEQRWKLLMDWFEEYLPVLLQEPEDEKEINPSPSKPVKQSRD